MPNWRYILGICAEGLRKTTKYFSRQLFTECNSEVFLLSYLAWFLCKGVSAKSRRKSVVNVEECRKLFLLLYSQNCKTYRDFAYNP